MNDRKFRRVQFRHAHARQIQFIPRLILKPFGKSPKRPRLRIPQSAIFQPSQPNVIRRLLLGCRQIIRAEPIAQIRFSGRINEQIHPQLKSVSLRLLRSQLPVLRQILRRVQHQNPRAIADAPQLRLGLDTIVQRINLMIQRQIRPFKRRQQFPRQFQNKIIERLGPSIRLRQQHSPRLDKLPQFGDVRLAQFRRLMTRQIQNRRIHPLRPIPLNRNHLPVQRPLQFSAREARQIRHIPWPIRPGAGEAQFVHDDRMPPAGQK